MGVLIGGLALLASTPACKQPETGGITGPSAPTVGQARILGPASVAPGQSAQFEVEVMMSDGRIKRPAAGDVRWRSGNFLLLSVDQTSGLATARSGIGETTLTVDVTVAGGVRRQTAEVVVVPEGTFRVTGVIHDAQFPSTPVEGATIDVVPGSLSTTTDQTGAYRLYGVPADAELRVTAPGYQPRIEPVHLSGHTSSDLALEPSGPRPDLSGPYTLALDVVGACDGGTRTLPTALQHRQYDVVLTQNGIAVTVALTEARFEVSSAGRGNHFSGLVNSGGATFTLEPYDSYYYPYGFPLAYPDVAERLSDGTFLVTQGRVVMTGSASGLTGELSELPSNFFGNAMHQWDSRFPAASFLLAQCRTPTIRLTLTPR